MVVLSERLIDDMAMVAKKESSKGTEQPEYLTSYGMNSIMRRYSSTGCSNDRIETAPCVNHTKEPLRETITI